MASASSEQLQLLHQEMAALVRAGMPLDRGLRALAADLPGNLGRLANQIAEHLERGESIEQALGSTGSSQQRVYAAVFAAGIRSGNLARSLESVVAAARAGQQLRRSLWADLLYPLMLLVLGYGLLEFSLRKLLPVQARMGEAFGESNTWLHPFLPAFAWMLENPHILYLLIGAAIVGLVWLISRGTSLDRKSGIGVGPFARFRANQAWSRYCDLLAMMIEHSVPLPEALALAGEASGWKKLASASVRASERLRRGESVEAEPPIPGTVLWLASTQAPTSAAMLRREAEHHRMRAEIQARWLARWLPLGLTLLIGVTLVALLALVNLGPFINLLWRLSRAD